jgi:2-oxoglutarate ferredoxin oxidoreductase subunit alpha
MNGRQNLQGNHACALAAVAARCRFYGGYPITPSSEVAEHMSQELPRVGGVFIQMEDEIASMASVIGASMGGARAMTATSGPGLSLKQENLGYAVMAEIPCVVVNVMRGGPSTGLPTRPSQGDIIQARWGTHGDHPIVVLAPASVREVHEQTIRAFNLSEVLRIPVIVLYDEVIRHLVETVDLPDPDSIERADGRWATVSREDYVPYADPGDGIPAMARPGDGYRVHITGLTHGEHGFPPQNPTDVDNMMQRILGKLDRPRAMIECYEALHTEDADVLVLAIGITARAARAVRLARARGVRAGLFRPVTLWPFPEQAFSACAERAGTVLVAEMNAGQMALEAERLCAQPDKVVRLNRLNGEPIDPAEILSSIEERARHGYA